MDAGARGRRLLQRREYRAKVSEFIPKELEDHVVYEAENITALPFSKTLEKGVDALDRFGKKFRQFDKNRLGGVIRKVFGSSNPGSNYTPSGKVTAEPYKDSYQPEGEMVEANAEQMKAMHDAKMRKKEDDMKKKKKVDEACWKGYEKKGMKTMFGKRYPNCVKKTKKEEVQLEAKKSCGEGEYYCHDRKKCMPIPDGMKVGKDGMLMKEAKVDKKLTPLQKIRKRNKGEAEWGTPVGYQTNMRRAVHAAGRGEKKEKGKKDTTATGRYLRLAKEDMKGMSQKSGDKRSTESGAGMTAQGVAKYNRRTGGNLKTAVTTPPSKLKPGSKAAKRRKSFCARSKSWTGPRGKAARRRWNCSYEPELPMIIDEKKLYNGAPLSDRVAAWARKINESKLIRGPHGTYVDGQKKDTRKEPKINPKLGLPVVDRASYNPQGDVISEIDFKKTFNNIKSGITNTMVNFGQGLKVIKKAVDNPGTGINPNTRRALELDKKLNQSYVPQGEMIERTMTTPEKKKKEDYVKGMKKDKKGFTKRYGKDAKSVMYATATKMAMKEAKDEKKKSVKGIAKELDKAVAMHKSQAKRLRSAGVSEGFYQKKYAGVGKGYETVGKNKRMDKSNKRGGDSKKQYRDLHKEGSLHSWFKGSKSKDGKPGWVNVVTGGTCASDKPGEGTPKCVSSSKRASMSKSERLSASRRKKKADPGQQSKSGAAKPTYVSTDTKKKKVKEELGNPLEKITTGVALRFLKNLPKISKRPPVITGTNTGKLERMSRAFSKNKNVIPKNNRISDFAQSPSSVSAKDAIVPATLATQGAYVSQMKKKK